MKTNNDSEKLGSAEWKKIAALFVQSPVSMAVLLGHDHIYQFANKTYLNLIDKTDVVGLSVQQVLPEMASQGVIQLLDQVYKTGERFQTKEHFIQIKDPVTNSNKDLYLDFTYDPIRESDGSIIGIMVIVVDVSAQVIVRKEVEKSKSQLETERANFHNLYDEAEEIIAVMSGPEMRFEFVNSAYKNYVNQDVTGKTVYESRPEAHALFRYLEEVYRTGVSKRFKATAVQVGNQTRYLDFIYIARRNSKGEIDGIMSMAKDVTESVLANERLQREKNLEAMNRELLEKQQAWLETILNRVPSIVLMLEPGTGRALFANEAAKKFYGEDVVRRGPQKRFSELSNLQDGQGNYLTWDQAPSSRAARGEIFQDVEVIVTRGNAKEYLLASSEVLQGAGAFPDTILIFAQDITAIRQAEEAQRKIAARTQNEKDRLRRLFAQAPVGISIIRGPEHIYELVNNNYVKMTGDREYIGKKFVEVFPEIQGQGVVELLDEVFKTKVPYHGIALPVQLKNENGEIQQCYFDFITQPLFEDDGSVSALMTVALDVTAQVVARNSMDLQQKKIQESETRFRMLADSMPQIVWTARPDGILNYTNKRWTDYSGSSDPEMWLSFVHPDDTARVVETWTQCVQSGSPYETEFRIQNKTNEYRWHLVRAVQIFNSTGEVTNWFGTCTDIQDHKEAKAIAEAASSAKTSFLANMSHEIRTPLAAILGFADLMNSSDIGPSEKKHLDVIIRNSHALTRVIDDILDISKIEAGKLDIEKIAFSPKETLYEVTGLFSEKFKEKHISLNIQIDSSVPGELISDPLRLRQILVNIIGNSIKFTSEGSVTVKMATRQGDDGHVILTTLVEDTGVGIDAHQAEKLFQPFSQGDSGTNRKFGGTGLGLVISLKLAQALGGHLRLLQAKKDHGSVFEIEIKAEVVKPKSNPLHVSPLKTKIGKDRLRGIRILGVDDSNDNRTLMEYFLKREEAIFEEADSGEMAISKINQGDFDVVLMDIQMPGIDGYEAVRILREKGYKKPIIALTAHAMEEERKKSLASGFDDHVTKPIDSNILVEAILRQSRSPQP